MKTEQEAIALAKRVSELFPDCIVTVHLQELEDVGGENYWHVNMCYPNVFDFIRSFTSYKQLDTFVCFVEKATFSLRV